MTEPRETPAIELGLKFDLRAPSFGTRPADLYRAALDQSEWADRVGFDMIRLMEHHGSDDGYCPSPLVMSVALAARTERVRLRIQALILPLHDPVRIAEDAAVADLISGGRLELVIGAGYVDEEFEMFGRSLSDRVALVEEGIMVLRRAWAGASPVCPGRPGRVMPAPVGAGPPILLGGLSAAAARRAARIADGFEPVSGALIREYLAECERLGKKPGFTPPRTPRASLVFVAEDPDDVWARLAPHVMHEMNAYGQWLGTAGVRGGFHTVRDMAELRSSGVYEVVTPAECVQRVSDLAPRGRLELHPLVGGLDPNVGWQSLQLFADEVLPALRDRGLVDRDPGHRPAGALRSG